MNSINTNPMRSALASSASSSLFSTYLMSTAPPELNLPVQQKTARLMTTQFEATAFAAIFRSKSAFYVTLLVTFTVFNLVGTIVSAYLVQKAPQFIDAPRWLALCAGVFAVVEAVAVGVVSAWILVTVIWTAAVRRRYYNPADIYHGLHLGMRCSLILVGCAFIRLRRIPVRSHRDVGPPKSRTASGDHDPPPTCFLNDAFRRVPPAVAVLMRFVLVLLGVCLLVGKLTALLPVAIWIGTSGYDSGVQIAEVTTSAPLGVPSGTYVRVAHAAVGASKMEAVFPAIVLIFQIVMAVNTAEYVVVNQILRELCADHSATDGTGYMFGTNQPDRFSHSWPATVQARAVRPAASFLVGAPLSDFAVLPSLSMYLSKNDAFSWLVVYACLDSDRLAQYMFMVRSECPIAVGLRKRFDLALRHGNVGLMANCLRESMPTSSRMMKARENCPEMFEQSISIGVFAT